jgi:integrase
MTGMLQGLLGTSYLPPVERLQQPRKGFHTWTLDEAKRFVEAHPIGTKAHLAFALLAHTGIRVSDLCQLGRQHLNKQGVVSKPQHKNRRRDAKIIEFDNMHYLVTGRGIPFSIKGMANKVKEWCIQAGIPHCSAHGIRKFASVRGAENGMTAEQMKAFFGWSTSRQADAYTEKANKKMLTNQAVQLLSPTQDENKIAPRTGS